MTQDQPAAGYIVTLENKGNRFWFRGTNWAFERDRAQVFASEDAARAALLRAKQFMGALVYRKAQVIPC